MRKPALFVGMTLFVLAGSARADDEIPGPAPEGEGGTPAAAAEPAAEGAATAAAAGSESKMQAGIAFLPMFLGRAGIGSSGDDIWYDISSPYGVGLSFGYNVIAGLSVGLAPQALFHLKAKDPSGYEVLKSEKEFDIMARIAYAYGVIPKLAVYAEVLPGYSIITYDVVSAGTKLDKPKGLVIGFGVGAAYDITDMFFANLGVGYQIGFQKTTSPSDGKDNDVKTKFLRIAVGGGMKF